MSETHPWRLVAPWYRWERQYRELGLRPRASRPVLQKYATTELVKEFLAEPQHSVTFDDADQVYTSVPFTGVLIEKEPDGVWRQARLSDHMLVPGTPFMRKLFLGTHGRGYLVVCELRCDTPGFPRIPPAHARDAVCEAGFVVRRPHLAFPSDAEPTLRALAGRVSALAIDAARLAGSVGYPARVVPRAVLQRWRAVREPLRRRRLAETRAALAAAREALVAWSDTVGPRQLSQGWIPSSHPGIGAWDVVDDTPAVLVRERVYPLHRLTPDPRDAWHTGQGRAIFFGVVPTGSADHDEQGTPCFDDQSEYEIRCFVRRHRPQCKRTSSPNDCNGELVWSAPTERFRLAAHFDLTGTSQRPLTIQLPDLKQLGAQAADLTSPGLLSSSRLMVPCGGELGAPFPFPMPGMPSTPVYQSMQISVPLVTAVAMFLLNLFLPIVVFLFGLYSLLPLRLWLPCAPSVPVSNDLAQLAGPDGLAKMQQQYTKGTLDTLQARFDAPAPPNYATALHYEERVDYEFPPDPPPVASIAATTLAPVAVAP